jgi:hypothetical protein
MRMYRILSRAHVQYTILMDLGPCYLVTYHHGFGPGSTCLITYMAKLDHGVEHAHQSPGPRWYHFFFAFGRSGLHTGLGNHSF